MKRNTLLRLAVISLTLFLVAGLAQTAFAQWSNDPNVSAPICTTAGPKSGLTAVNDGAGGIIAAWGEGTRVLAQRLGSDGQRLWVPEGVVVLDTPPTVSHFRMVSDCAGGAIILQAPMYYGWFAIRLQRINSSGASLWGNVWISNSFQSVNFISAEIVSDGVGGVIVVWADSRSGSPRYYAQRLDANGNALWNPDGVAVCPAAVLSSSNIDITTDGGGGAIIAWTDHRAGQDDPNIFAQKISATGIVQWVSAGIPIAVLPGGQADQILASDGAGGAFIAWNDRRPNQEGVYAQLINAAGVSQWIVNGIRVSSSLTSYWWPRSIVRNGSGGVVVAWSERRSCGSEGGAAQCLSGSGTLLWPAGGIDLTGCGGFYPSVITDGQGGFVAVWDRAQAQVGDIFAQRFNAAGVWQWVPSGVAISTTQFFDVHGPPILDGRGGVIVPWTLQNPVGTGQGLYAQRLKLDGTLGAASMIANGGFEQGLTSWSGGGCVTPTIIQNGCSSTSAAKVLINGANCSAQFYQRGFAIERGKRYRVSFNAWSSRGEDMQLTILPHNASTFNIGLDRRVDLGTNPCASYSFEFTATGSTSDARLRFMFNYMSTTGYWYCFDNVVVEKVLAKEGIAENEVPASFQLEQNYPNPFNPTTNISFSIPNDGDVSLKVFDLLGREVATLVNDARAAGSYVEAFDASALSSGTYFYRLESGSLVQTKKMLILR